MSPSSTHDGTGRHPLETPTDATPFESSLGIQPGDPSLEELIAREEDEHCDAFFHTTDAQEIAFMKTVIGDIDPAGQVWLRAYLLDQYRDPPAGIADMSIRTFWPMHGELMGHSPYHIDYGLAMREALLVFLSTLNFEAAETAPDLTPRILIEELEYPPIYAFHILSRYVTSSVEGAMKLHTQLVQKKIAEINDRKAKERQMAAA